MMSSHSDLDQISTLTERVRELERERDEALMLAEGPSTLIDLARGSVERGLRIVELEAALPATVEQYHRKVIHGQVERAILRAQRDTVLDAVYDRINALGSPDTAEYPDDQFAKGVNHAVDAALKIIGDLRTASAAMQKEGEG